MQPRTGKIKSAGPSGVVKIVADDTGETITTYNNRYRQITDVDLQGDPIYGSASQHEDTPLSKNLAVVFSMQGADASKIHRFGTVSKWLDKEVGRNKVQGK